MKYIHIVYTNKYKQKKDKKETYQNAYSSYL